LAFKGISTMKIMIIDPHILFRAGLVSLLHDLPNIEIMEDGGLESDLVEQVSNFEPDVIIMGGDLYEDGGREMMTEILNEHPDIAVLILAFRESVELMLDAIRNGAKGYLPMDVSETVLIKSLYAMARGEVAISRSMTTKVAEEFSRLTRVVHDNTMDLESLTFREQQVLRLLATDATNNEIALKLFISNNTVRIHVSSILKKLNLRNRREAGELVRRMMPEWNEQN